MGFGEACGFESFLLILEEYVYLQALLVTVSAPDSLILTI